MILPTFCKHASWQLSISVDNSLEDNSLKSLLAVSVLPAVFVLALIPAKHATHKNNNITAFIDSILAKQTTVVMLLVTFYFFGSQKKFPNLSFWKKNDNWRRKKKSQIVLSQISTNTAIKMSYRLFVKLSLCYFNISAKPKSINTFKGYSFPL